jgi:hypothetical protein
VNKGTDRMKAVAPHTSCMSKNVVVAWGMLHDAPHLAVHNADITRIVRSTQFWFEHAVHLRVLHVSAFCCHHQVHRASTFTFLSIYICYTSQRWPLFLHWECVVQVMLIV